jgi:hypothetical protein
MGPRFLKAWAFFSHFAVIYAMISSLGVENDDFIQRHCKIVDKS